MAGAGFLVGLVIFAVVAQLKHGSSFDDKVRGAACAG